jgi:hypothetical protein
MKRNLLLVVLCATGVAGIMQPGPVRADATDGEWCSENGRHLSIQGSKIITPQRHANGRCLFAPLISLRYPIE